MKLEKKQLSSGSSAEVQSQAGIELVDNLWGSLKTIVKEPQICDESNKN